MIISLGNNEELSLEVFGAVNLRLERNEVDVVDVREEVVALSFSPTAFK